MARYRWLQDSSLHLLATSLVIVTIGCSGSPPEQQVTTADVAVPDHGSPPSSQWVDVVITEGTEFSLALIGRLASDTTTSGEIFRTRLTEPVIVGSREVLPVGSIFEGFVGEVTPAGQGGEQGGTVALSFRVVRTQTGSAAQVTGSLTRVGAPGEGGPVILETADPGGAGSGQGAASSLIAAGTPGRELVLEPETQMTLILLGTAQIKIRE